MDGIRIQTTQNVDISYEPASVGDRILATLLDYVFFIAYVLLFILLFSANNYDPQGVVVYIILALPVLFYDLICESLFEGRSFGKMIMKIKVVKLDGTQAGFGAYLLRWLLRIVDTRIFSGAVALIAIILSDKGQRIGDMAAGTTVIKLKQKVKLSDTILNQQKKEHVVMFKEVSRMSDQDVAIIKEVLQLSIRNGNTDAIARLAEKTKQTMGISSNMPNTQFLTTVLADYSHYQFE